MTDQRHLALTWFSLQLAHVALSTAFRAMEIAHRQTETVMEFTEAVKAWRESDLEATRLIKELGDR